MLRLSFNAPNLIQRVFIIFFQKADSTMRYFNLWRHAAILIVSLFWLTGVAGAADNQMSSQDQGEATSQYWLARPVYLDIHSASKKSSFLSRQDIADMATKAIKKFGPSTILMDSQTLPDRVRVLRVIYIVHEQPTDRGTVIAASAKIGLLRTAADQYNTVLATSIYSGLQQSLIQDADRESARRKTREAFQKSLDKRIDQAFTDTAAQ